MSAGIGCHTAAFWYTRIERGVKSMKETTSPLAANLAGLRKCHQYSQEEVAEKIGVTRQAVAKWESGVSLR